ncbi:GyrI-like domain-containing protein [Nocardioides sp. GCM10027113]|uniref:GyrI-like domain-containing protein n=1 Tax=unclassified Nocardioides TaxID=2615069 RepID=UPI0036084A3E
MDNYDVKRERRELYGARSTFELVDVPPMTFVMADGAGNPNAAPAYAEVVESLYVVSYAIRACAVAELGRKHTVGPLEGLWWADDLAVFASRDRDEWQWRMMIVQPDWVTDELFAAGLARAEKKHPPAADLIRLEMFHEGPSVQVLHVGPYDAEAPTIARMHDEFLPSQGLRPRGHHHEIYLSDPRRVAPEQLRTILRQPVEPLTASNG